VHLPCSRLDDCPVVLGGLTNPIRHQKYNRHRAIVGRTDRMKIINPHSVVSELCGQHPTFPFRALRVFRGSISCRSDESRQNWEWSRQAPGVEKPVPFGKNLSPSGVSRGIRKNNLSPSRKPRGFCAGQNLPLRIRQPDRPRQLDRRLPENLRPQNKAAAPSISSIPVPGSGTAADCRIIACCATCITGTDF
jgi:hypothetical protein